MHPAYSELVIEGPFHLVKGFLTGYRCRGEEPFGIFYHRKAGIRRETFGDVVADLFDLEHLVHVCVEERVLDDLRAAIARAEPIIGIRVRSVRRVESAAFSYSVRVYNEDLAEACAFLTDELPPGVERTEFVRFSLAGNDDEPRLSGTAPAHRFDYGCKGDLSGPLGEIVDLYLKCKRSRAHDFIITSDVTLQSVPEFEAVPA